MGQEVQAGTQVMRLSAAKTLPPQEIIRAHLNAVSWGHDSVALDGIDGRKPFSVVLLPQYTKVLSDTKTGTRLVDAHLTWAQGTVVAVPRGGDSSVSLPWHVVEHRKKQRGTATITARADGNLDVTGYPEHAEPARIHGGVSRNYRRMQAQLSESGRTNAWQLLAALETHVTLALESANRTVARELEGDTREDDEIDLFVDRSNHGAVDSITLENLCGELMFGVEGRKEGSVLLRLIQRCATTPINQQPVASYLAVNILSSAEVAIRRYLEDPHIGRKIRRLARDQQIGDLDTLLDAYRASHPRDELGRKRAVYALSAGKTLDATSLTTEHPGLGTPMEEVRRAASRARLELELRDLKAEVARARAEGGA